VKYHEYLKTLTRCPFCNEKGPRIILENSNAFLTYSLAPYHKHHLLVIPKRHVDSVKELTLEENVSIIFLISIGIKALDKLGHNDCSILARDGKASEKSIPHLHFHIIPEGVMVDVTIKNETREILNEEEEKYLREEFKKATSS
jgi:diadenosine tetraphosphate (Ap4A) HIT family hydrolase